MCIARDDSVFVLSFRLLCRWNVQCPSDQLMYFDIVEHTVEPTQESDLFRVSI